MFTISVDGKHVDPGAFGFHAQQQPYPGGGNFKLLITDPNVVAMFSKHFGEGDVREMPQSTCNHVFNLIRLALDLSCVRHEFQYWGNSIQSMSISSDRVAISGVCSPHMG